MNKSIAGFLVALLFAPAIASSFVDCTENINGCPTTEARIVALQAQIVQLTQLLQQLLAQKSPSLSGNPTCFVPTYDLYIGRTDADTNGEVKKLQLLLKAEGYFPDAQQGTGYYGEKTAAAVVKWQKAHGMDFVTTKSGVGKQTRAKMQEQCSGAVVNTCTSGRTLNPPADLPPVITSLSRSSGPIGSILEIRGCNLSSFEGDLGVTFEAFDGKQIGLTDTFGSYAKTQDTLIKVLVKDPCAQGQTVYGPYSGLPTTCNYTPVVPGTYKVYTTPWGKKSNVMTFTVTGQ